MLATQKFTMRIKPDVHNQLAMLAAKLGRSKSGTISWLVLQATKDLPEQKVLIVKGKKRRNTTN